MSRVTLECKLVNESINEVFDFTSRLAVGETISSASTVATLYSGTDANAGSIVSGTASISGAKVTQKVIGGVLGNVYKLVCSATTSAGQILQLSAYMPIVPDAA